MNLDLAAIPRGHPPPRPTLEELPPPPGREQSERLRAVSKAAAAQGEALCAYLHYQSGRTTAPESLSSLKRNRVSGDTSRVLYAANSQLVFKRSTPDENLFLNWTDDGELLLSQLFAITLPGAQTGAVQVRLTKSSIPPMLIKRYQPHMLSLRALKKLHSSCIEEVLAALNSDSLLTIVLTLDYQMLDLHDRNIGFRFVLTNLPAPEQWRVEIPVFGQIHPLQEIFSLLDKEEISPKIDLIVHEDEGKTHHMRAETFSKFLLQKGARVQITLFDLEMNMVENNRVKEWETQDRGITLTLPIRNALLGTHFAQETLPNHLIDRILQLQPQIEESLRWMERRDGAIRQRLSKEDKKWLSDKLNPLLRNQHLLDHLSVPYCNYPRSLYRRKLAQLLQRRLNGEFWRSLAKRAHLPETYFLENEQRRRNTCLQLVPRISPQQMVCYKERIVRRTKYLEDYTKISRVTRSLENLRAFLSSHDSPLSTTQRHVYTKRIEQGSFHLDELYEEVLHAARPSINNLARVMYPLLADYQEVLSSLYPGNFLAQFSEIGNYVYNIRDFHEKGKRTLSLRHKAHHSLEKFRADLSAAQAVPLVVDTDARLRSTR